MSSLLAVSELPEPELTPLEECSTKEGGPVEEPLTDPSSRFTVDSEDARMEACTLCLLPSLNSRLGGVLLLEEHLTERDRKLYLASFVMNGELPDIINAESES